MGCHVTEIARTKTLISNLFAFAWPLFPIGLYYRPCCHLWPNSSDDSDVIFSDHSSVIIHIMVKFKVRFLVSPSLGTWNHSLISVKIDVKPKTSSDVPFQWIVTPKLTKIVPDLSFLSQCSLHYWECYPLEEAKTKMLALALECAVAISYR